MSDQVLVIDDEAGVRTTLRRALEEEGFCVATADSARTGLRRAKADHPDVAVVDLKLGDGSGLDVLRDLKEISPSTVTIMISAYGDVQDVVQAMKLAAEMNPDEIVLVNLSGRGDKDLGIYEGLTR